MTSRASSTATAVATAATRHLEWRARQEGELVYGVARDVTERIALEAEMASAPGRGRGRQQGQVRVPRQHEPRDHARPLNGVIGVPCTSFGYVLLAKPDAEKVASASIAVAEAKAATTEIAIQATNKLFELAGTQATLAKFNLDRHWRNARAHTLHDPVRWKYYAIGNYYLNAVRPKRHGAL